LSITETATPIEYNINIIIVKIIVILFSCVDLVSRFSKKHKIKTNGAKILSSDNDPIIPKE
jgi:hypothetical protein